MAFLLKRRQDTNGNWVSVDPVIPDRQLTFTQDAGGTGIPLIKIGNGVSTWSSLPYINKRNNLEASTDPTVTDDADLFYSVGSLWSNNVIAITPVFYICVDATVGAAQWSQISGSGGGGGGTSTPFEESFVAVSTQVIFSLANTPSAAWVWINGAAQDASTWSISGDDIVLSTPSTVGDTVEVYYLTDASVVSNVLIPIVTASANGELGDASYYRVTAGTTFTLPAAIDKFSAVNAYTIRIKNVSGGNITVTADGSDTIYTTSAVSFITMADGDMVSLIAGTATNWDLI